MNSRAECGRYFRSQKELKRLFEGMRRKWQSYGRCAGTVNLKNCSIQERKAFGKLLGKVFSESEVRITLQQVEQALQETRFAPITVEEFLESYFQEKLVTNNSRKQEKRQRREIFFQKIQREIGQEGENAAEVCRWYQAMEQEQKYGYGVLIREWEKEEKTAETLAKKVGEALIWTNQEEKTEIPIAVLAAQIIGNPHYFDRGLAAGTLLMQGLSFLQKREFPTSAYEWKEVLNIAGILPDDVASTVITYGVHVQKRGILHEGIEAFYRMKEPITLTSVNLIHADAAFGENHCAFVVENEMVFRYLYEQIKESGITLVCTSGQMRTAALKLIQLLVQGGTTIYYSGDMDPEGLGIADRIWKKFPKAIKLWRMTPADYQKGISQENLEERSMVQLEKLENLELRETAEHMKREKRAAYQENLLDEMVEDLER